MLLISMRRHSLQREDRHPGTAKYSWDLCVSVMSFSVFPESVFYLKNPVLKIKNIAIWLKKIKPRKPRPTELWVTCMLL